MCRRRYSHLASVDAIVGDLEVGGRPGLFVVEPVSEHDDLYDVGQERHDKGLNRVEMYGSSVLPNKANGR